MNPNAPFFKEEPHDSPIQRLVGRIVVFPSGDEIFVGGTCFRIARNLYITCKHVIDDLVEQFGSQNHLNAQMHVIHIEEGPDYSIWTVDRMWTLTNSDLAVVHTVELFTTTPPDRPRVRRNVFSASLELPPPMKGEKISAFGYPDTSGTITSDGENTHVEIQARGYTATGEVTQIHYEKREDLILNFPCFETTARFDRGMSGGPIFNERGSVCGVICRGVTTLNPDDPTYSYGITLWPLLGLMLDIDATGNAVPTAYPFLDLAKRGVIAAKGWERASVEISPDNAAQVLHHPGDWLGK